MTVQEVYLLALKLMGEESEDGTDQGYTEEYLAKAIGILNVLHTELLPSNVESVVLTHKEDALQVTNRIAKLVLPYGLASHLLMDEDQNRAAFFNARYDELKRKQPATITTITDVYSINSGLT